MKKLLTILIICSLSGCVGRLSPEAQLEHNRPIKVAEADGVAVWKVRDDTRGGSQWVYFTTPSGHLSTDWLRK